MAEYIERLQLIGAIKACKNMMNKGVSRQNMTQKDMMKIIEEMPAADVATVVHGEWKQMEDYNWDSYWRCSACGEDFWLESGTTKENSLSYCLTCGARMDGDANG